MGGRGMMEDCARTALVAAGAFSLLAFTRWLHWYRNRDARDNWDDEDELDRWWHAQIALSDVWMTMPFIVTALLVWLGAR